jgi:uncharacterized protein YfaS (alpha-2-macroglobulin family)
MVAPGDEFDVSVGVSNNLEGLNGQSVAINVLLTPPPQLEVGGQRDAKPDAGGKNARV